MPRLSLVRHGRAAGWDTDPDPGLDALGQRQAQAVATRLAPVGPQLILCSPLRRCWETSAPLVARRHTLSTRISITRWRSHPAVAENA